MEEQMATDNRLGRQIPPTEGRTVRADGRNLTTEPQISELLKQLAGESGDLVRNEMALAKLEVREMVRQLAIDSAKVGAAIALAATGGLALVAAAIIAVGDLLGGMYAVSALIIGVLFLAIGGILAKNGVDGLKQPHKPEETARTMKQNKEWASREVREFKQEIRS
jgi:hypothetical protein